MLKIAIVMVFVLLLQASVAAEIIHVPGDYPTIQEGIDAAVFGDEVLVGPGVYTNSNEYLIYEGSWLTLPVIANLKDGVSLVAEAGPSQTRIVGWLRTPMIGVYGDSLSSAVRVSGFTIATCGHGVLFYASGEVTVENCWIDTTTNCGVACYDASPIISNNVLLHCSNDGVRTHGTSYPYVSGNVIGWSGDDGIENDPPAVPVVIGNTLVYCGTTPGNPSQAIDTGGQDFLIQQNIIAWNEAAFYSPSGCTIIQNDIYGNGGSNTWEGNISEDPQFCDLGALLFRIADTSPCAPGNNPWGVLIGAGEVGCATAVSHMSWARIKALYLYGCPSN